MLKKYISSLVLIVIVISSLVIINNINLVKGANDDNQNPGIYNGVENIDHLSRQTNIVYNLSKNTKLGVKFSNTESDSPYMFIIFKQILGYAKILNTANTVIDRFPIITENVFLISFEDIIEFRNTDNNSYLDSRNEIEKWISLSNIEFTHQVHNLTDSIQQYSITLESINNRYFPRSRPNEVLDSLKFTFNLTISKTEVTEYKIPEITFKKVGERIVIKKEPKDNNASGFIYKPEMKFSFDIVGWDFSTDSSKLMVNINLLSLEQYTTNVPEIARRIITQQALKDSKLLNSMQLNFKDEIIELDHFEADTRNFSQQRRQFSSNQITMKDNLRTILEFNWVGEVSIDGTISQTQFQPIFSNKGIINGVNALILRGGFIFSQGNTISYDPTLKINDFNPSPESLEISQPPNRVLIGSNSLLILIFGIFIIIALPIIKKIS